MEKQIINVGSIKIIVYSFLEYFPLLKNKGKFVKIVSNKVKNIEKNNFAGFKNKEGFEAHLDFSLKGQDTSLEYPNLKLKEFVRLIKEIFNKIKKIVDGEEIYIYLFPTLSKFIVEKMGGVGGMLVWDNIIYLDFFPKEGWEKNFKSTLTHELAHIVSKYYGDNYTISQGIIFEGLAEHFQESYIEVKNPWTRAISETQILKILGELKKNGKLNGKNFSLYNELFYGTGKYPLWAGYTIGYYMVGKYLKKQKNIDWKKLLRVNPEIILNFVLKDL